MKILVFTQKIDAQDSTLGFFSSWVVELSKRCDTVTVIALEVSQETIATLPKNVTVYSLGKEQGKKGEKNSGKSDIGYALAVYQYLWKERGNYDTVFVHMNQEYVLLAGLYWKIKNIPVYFWRNHPRGSILTRIAIFFSTKVFYTSPLSFTRRFKKSVMMPVGVDTHVFAPVSNAMRTKYSVCMIGRIAPIKRVDMALEAVSLLVASGVQVSLTIVGSALPRDARYYDSLISYVADRRLAPFVTFVPAVSPDALPAIYSMYEIILNLTEDGSFDKTIVEGAACGTMPLVTNTSLAGIVPDVCLVEATSDAIADGIQKLFDPSVQLDMRAKLQTLAEAHSLDALMKRLEEEII